MRHVASVSFGKDSLYMLLQLIERGAPLDEVVFYDTGMEFQAIYDTRDAVLPLLAAHGIKYTELHPEYSFLWKMFDKPVDGKNGFHYGYSWCGGRCRWGTTDKLKAIEKHCKDAVQYVGIAIDEDCRYTMCILPYEGKVFYIDRRGNPNKQYPLCDWNVTEADALAGCYAAGFEWWESGHRLYDILDRVSCWCCANKNLKELRGIWRFLPSYWARLKDLQARTERPMKGPGKSVFDLEARFIKEQQQERRRKSADI